jgi:uncharacterized protein (DUF2235 family)
MKRIAICADGTWNRPDQTDEETGKRRPTNVIKIARAIKPLSDDKVHQVVIYHDGLGTRGGLDKLKGGGFGDGIEDIIRNLYRNILYNYVEGDELYFFGFSRGAYTARTLAGFMNRVGLVEKYDDYFVLDLYDCYASQCAEDSEKWIKAHRHITEKRPCPPIKMIGVWDTVGALGVPGRIGRLLDDGKHEYHDVMLNSSIQNAYHALAIDERRAPFKPTLWEKPPGWNGKLEQAWFPGVHSNVGGSYTPDGLANEALHWIVEKAENLGLEMDKAYLEHFTPCFNSKLHDSYGWQYNLAGGEHHRPIGNFTEHGECLHQATIDRRNLFANYRPQMLEKYLAKGNAPPYAQTRRIARGTPCPPLPERND